VTQSPSSDAAFRMVFDAHHDAVHRFCMRRLGVDDGNDATAEVFLVAWRRMDAMPEQDEPLPWLYGVARNVVRNHRRTRQRKVRLVSRLSSQSKRRTCVSRWNAIMRRCEMDLSGLRFALWSS